MANLDQTSDEIVEHYASMLHSANLLLGYLVLDGTNGSSANAGSSLLLEDGGKITVETMRDVKNESNAEWVLKKARNVDHLTERKAMKHVDNSSWWTSESFTAINKAIAS